MALSQRRARLIRRLRSRRTREREGLVLVEGVRAVGEALDADAALSFAVAAPKLAATQAGTELESRIAGLDVESVGDDELARLADTRSPQGVLCVCAEPRSSLAGIRGRRILVLDAIQDPGNAGTLIRSAVAFGLDAVMCLDGTVDPWAAKTVRASAGAVFRMPVVTAGATEALDWIGGRNLPLLVADADGESVSDWRGADGYALAVANEGAGARRELRERAAATVSVTMPGPVESLNAAVAGSILMHVLAGGLGE
jgi:TrmH family RNA methyltransferase